MRILMMAAALASLTGCATHGGALGTKTGALAAIQDPVLAKSVEEFRVARTSVAVSIERLSEGFAGLPVAQRGEAEASERKTLASNLNGVAQALHRLGGLVYRLSDGISRDREELEELISALTPSFRSGKAETRPALANRLKDYRDRIALIHLSVDRQAQAIASAESAIGERVEGLKAVTQESGGAAKDRSRSGKRRPRVDKLFPKRALWR